MKPFVLIIGGPTASGKSQAALDWALHHNGEIINGDSMQMYEPLKILTARPSEHEMAAVPHHLYGILEAEVWGSVASWYKQAIRCIYTIWERQKLPIVVGGTGMYLRALVRGLSPMPSIPFHIRKSVREMSATWDSVDFYQYVLKHDPEIEGRLHAGDTQRLARALEVFLATGKTLSSFQGNPKKELDFCSEYRVIMPGRKELYDRINARVIDMVEEGALREVEALAQKNLPPEHPLMKAVGVPQFMAHLRGECSLSEAITETQKASRQYAKRQITWFQRV